jgi:hypothetical protein
VRYTYYYCSNCEVWDIISNWSSHEVYFHDSDDRLEFYDDEENYIFDGGCSDRTAWEHDNCGQWFMHPDTDKRSVWVCGECKGEYSDQEDARACCS